MHVRIGIYLGEDRDHKLGPGKIALLEAIREHGSISGAARGMGMAYRHAWELVDDVNRAFREPAVTTATGGRAGGGARLTPFGEELVERFQRMEKAALRAMRRDLVALTPKLRRGRHRGRARR